MQVPVCVIDLRDQLIPQSITPFQSHTIQHHHSAAISCDVCRRERYPRRRALSQTGRGLDGYLFSNVATASSLHVSVFIDSPNEPASVWLLSRFKGAMSITVVHGRRKQIQHEPLAVVAQPRRRPHLEENLRRQQHRQRDKRLEERVERVPHELWKKAEHTCPRLLSLMVSPQYLFMRSLYVHVSFTNASLSKSERKCRQ